MSHITLARRAAQESLGDPESSLDVLGWYVALELAAIHRLLRLWDVPGREVRTDVDGGAILDRLDRLSERLDKVRPADEPGAQNPDGLLWHHLRIAILRGVLEAAARLDPKSFSTRRAAWEAAVEQAAAAMPAAPSYVAWLQLQGAEAHARLHIRWDVKRLGGRAVPQHPEDPVTLMDLRCSALQAVLRVRQLSVPVATRREADDPKQAPLAEAKLSGVREGLTLEVADVRLVSPRSEWAGSGPPNVEVVVRLSDAQGAGQRVSDIQWRVLVELAWNVGPKPTLDVERYAKRVVVPTARASGPAMRVERWVYGAPSPKQDVATLAVTLVRPEGGGRGEAPDLVLSLKKDALRTVTETQASDDVISAELEAADVELRRHGTLAPEYVDLMAAVAYRYWSAGRHDKYETRRGVLEEVARRWGLDIAGVRARAAQRSR